MTDLAAIPVKDARERIVPQPPRHNGGCLVGIVERRHSLMLHGLTEGKKRASYGPMFVAAALVLAGIAMFVGET